MIAGAAERALANSAATAFSAWPTYLLKSSGPFTARKFSLASLATARARRVLLQPGGPYNRTPACLKHTLRNQQSGDQSDHHRACSSKHNIFTEGCKALKANKKVRLQMKAASQESSRFCSFWVVITCRGGTPVWYDCSVLLVEAEAG